MQTRECPAIDPTADTLIPIAKLATERTGKRPSPSTIWRWIKRGCRGVPLPAVIVGPTWHTTREAWGWWVSQQTTVAMQGRADLRQSATDDQLQAAGLL